MHDKYWKGIKFCTVDQSFAMYNRHGDMYVVIVYTV